MAISVELLKPEQHQAVRAFISATPTALVQHTLEWSDVITALGQDEPAHLIARDGSGHIVAMLPAYVFCCELGNLLLSIPQPGGYGGIVTAQGADKETVFPALIDAFAALGRQRECVLATIIEPPFCADRELYTRHFRADIVKENFYQFIDLEKPLLENVGSKPRYNLLRAVRKAKEAGFQFVISDDDTHFEQWYAIHLKRMAELSAVSLPAPLYKEIRRTVVNAGLGYFAYALFEQKVVAGALFVGRGEVMDVFSISGDSEYFQHDPVRLVIHDALLKIKESGFKRFNWQSCSSRESSVYKFKKSWGSDEGLYTYHTRTVGDCRRILETPLGTLKEKYRWHYLLPYDRLTAG